MNGRRWLPLGGALLWMGLIAADPGPEVALPPPPLDGSEWAVTVTPDEAAAQQGEQPFRENLIFSEGQATMTTCLRRGFAPSSYTSDVSAGVRTFAAEQESLTDGKTVWTGQVNDATVTGTLAWTTGDGAVRQFAFQGTRVPPQPANRD